MLKMNIVFLLLLCRLESGYGRKILGQATSILFLASPSLQQAPFSPFSLLESLFSSPPQRNRQSSRTHRRQNKQTNQQQIFFRPVFPSSPGYSNTKALPLILDSSDGGQAPTFFSSPTIIPLSRATPPPTRATPIGSSFRTTSPTPFFRSSPKLRSPISALSDSAPTFLTKFNVTDGSFAAPSDFGLQFIQLNTFPETSNKFPETSNKFPETSKEFPETSNKFPETSNKFPETSNKSPETSKKFPETSSKPVGGFGFNESIGKPNQSVELEKTNDTESISIVYPSSPPIPSNPKEIQETIKEEGKENNLNLFHEKYKLSGPNPGDALRGPSYPHLPSYFDELLAPRPQQGVPTAPNNPFYSAEIFTYNQDPIAVNIREDDQETTIPPFYLGDTNDHHNEHVDHGHGILDHLNLQSDRVDHGHKDHIEDHPNHHGDRGDHDHKDHENDHPHHHGDRGDHGHKEHENDHPHHHSDHADHSHKDHIEDHPNHHGDRGDHDHEDHENDHPHHHSDHADHGHKDHDNDHPDHHSDRVDHDHKDHVKKENEYHKNEHNEPEPKDSDSDHGDLNYQKVPTEIYPFHTEFLQDLTKSTISDKIVRNAGTEIPQQVEHLTEFVPQSYGGILEEFAENNVQEFKIIPRGVNNPNTRENMEKLFSNRVDSILNDEHREHGARRIDDEDLGEIDKGDKFHQHHPQQQQQQEQQCGGASDLGFCGMTDSSYPTHSVHTLMNSCSQILDAFAAVIPDNVENLSDPTSDDMFSARREESVWSWSHYTNKKRQLCSSEVYFIRPGYAKDTKGGWYLIPQLDDLVQRVPVEICHHPNSPCPGLSECGEKSVCVQRYSFYTLLALEPQQSNQPHRDLNHTRCPTLRAFRFPSGCVCNVQRL